MQSKEATKISAICHHCHNKVIGWTDVDGVTKTQCRRCGTVAVSKPMSRRHVHIDVYMPKKQYLFMKTE